MKTDKTRRRTITHEKDKKRTTPIYTYRRITGMKNPKEHPDKHHRRRRKRDKTTLTILLLSINA
jgi:hypothetical protein